MNATTKPHLFYALIFCVLLISSHSLSAQNFYKEKFTRNQYFQIGMGMGGMYADNAGKLRAVEFKLNPAISLSMGRKIHQLVDLRGYVGYQKIKSQDVSYFRPAVISGWQEGGQAFEMEGHVIFMDLMPTVHLSRSNSHTERKKVDFYGGAGIGLMYALSTESRLREGVAQSENQSRVIGYIPARGGISYKLNLYSDLALEGSLMFSFSDELDGNQGFNRFRDHLLSGKIVYRRYLSNVKSTTY